MNLTEFAEQIVFGTTLEDKLLVPGKLTDDALPRQSPQVASLASPARPIGMQMQYGPGGNAQPPSDDRLENEQARGQLLHFLANHELLATELMALVLLKFPDAPPAFRQGVLATLREEQAHTRMYLKRMEACGVEFGSFPLSGQFWRVVEPMQSPLDFVARLSLTFEQANLDYSLHFAKVFARIGDQQTAAVLQKIYQDEIGHVQHGLHWFRQWKHPELSDWEAYQESLEFPMSPQRGRGPRGAFNRTGRMQAGLSSDFIDAIEVFRQSRGRAPTVRWFDPAAEAELAGELAPREAPLLQQLGKDLELALLGVAKQDDVVLVRRLPSQAFSRQLIDAGFDLPEFVLFEQRAKLSGRKLHDFAPWAWTPKNHEVAQPLVASTRHLQQPWQPETRDLFRKSWGSDRLRHWLSESAQQAALPSFFVDSGAMGIVVRNRREVQVALAELAQRGYQVALFKQDLAAAGRGQRRLHCQELLSEQDEVWLRAAFTSQQQGVIEPELERLVDLSFLWHWPAGAQQPNFLGSTQPQVTAGRRYAGTCLGNPFATCQQPLKRFLLADRCAALHKTVAWLEPRLARELKCRNFSGYFGIDALVCRDAQGDLKIKPLVELNPRMTMGHVALGLEKRLAPGVEAELRMMTIAQWQAAQQQMQNIPLQRYHSGHWQAGVIWLGEVDEQTKLIPAVLVGQQAIALARQLTAAVS